MPDEHSAAENHYAALSPERGRRQRWGEGAVITTWQEVRAFVEREPSFVVVAKGLSGASSTSVDDCLCMNDDTSVVVNRLVHDGAVFKFRGTSHRRRYGERNPLRTRILKPSGSNFSIPKTFQVLGSFSNCFNIGLCLINLAPPLTDQRPLAPRPRFRALPGRPSYISSAYFVSTTLFVLTGDCVFLTGERN